MLLEARRAWFAAAKLSLIMNEPFLLL